MLAGSASARPVAVTSASRASSSTSVWHHVLDFFRGFHPFASRFASDHTLPPPTTICWSNG